jgi:hypothetical protein
MLLSWAGIIAEQKAAAIISHIFSLVKGTVYPAQSSLNPPIQFNN